MQVYLVVINYVMHIFHFNAYIEVHYISTLYRTILQVSVLNMCEVFFNNLGLDQGHF